MPYLESTEQTESLMEFRVAQQKLSARYAALIFAPDLCMKEDVA